jgi:hypothetical protein
MKGQSMKTAKSRAMLAAALLPAIIATAASEAQGPPRSLPNPILYMTGMEAYTTPAGSFIRYRYDVFNKASYPAAMFAPAPGLPPCGNNANSSRTWVDFFENRTNRRIYGFCALGSPNDLGSIWFALPEGQLPPSYIYIEMNDRQTNTKYKSNLADTTL